VGKMGTSLVVKSQIKDYAKVGEKELSVSNDFYDALNKKVEKIIGEACIRAVANNRNTLMGRDV
jgi:histone H3/H4